MVLAQESYWNRRSPLAGIETGTAGTVFPATEATFAGTETGNRTVHSLRRTAGWPEPHHEMPKLFVF